MKTLTKIIFLFFIFFSTHNTYSQKTSKIGYIDMEYVYENSNLSNLLVKKFEAQKKRMTLLRNKYMKKLSLLKKELRDKEKFLGYTEFLKEHKKISRKIILYEAEVIQANNSLKKLESDLMGSVFDKILLVLEIIAKEEGLDVILSYKTDILYANTELDMSQRAIDLLNESNDRDTPTAK